jgi:aryl-alcohol dehydrogenase-like predicted oxidoreductase
MMGQRLLGATGIEVSAVGLGAWQLGRSAEWPAGPDPEEAVRIARAAFELGVTFIDTAPVYAGGQSELNVGAAIKGVPRDDYVLCTKVGRRPDGSVDWSPEAIEGSVRGSADRLGVEHLDVVVLHSPPPEVLASPACFEALHDLKIKGLIRAYGASVDQGHEVDTALARDAEVLEVRLSALYQEPLAALARAGERGAGAIIKVPLESGWLSGAYDAETRFTDVRARWTPADVALRAALVGEFHALLPDGVGVAEGALRFLLALDPVSTVIPGTRSLAHLEASVAAAAEGPLDPDTVDAVLGWYSERLGERALTW